MVQSKRLPGEVCTSHFFHLFIIDTLSFHRLLFQWLAIPWLQAEIDAWVRFKNRVSPCAVKNKILPRGIPALIRAIPAHFHALDFKVLFCSHVCCLTTMRS